VVSSQNVVTIVGTASYALAGQVIKILDVVYDTASAKSPIRHSTEDYERYLRADWLTQASGVPVRYAFQTFNTLSLVPPPSAVKTVSVRAIVQGTAFASGTDIPPIPDPLQEAIALKAAIFQGKAYCQGEASQRLATYEADYQKYVQDGKAYASLMAGGN
jgi:hypothetical protein